MKSRTSSSSLSLVPSRRFLRTAAASSVAALGLLVSARPADAAPKLAAEVDAVVPIDIHNISVGAGGALRFGYELRLPLIAITPEIGLGVYKFGDDLGPRVIRGIAGGRIGFGEIFRPGVYAHIGFGNEHVSATIGDLSISGSHTGAAFDAGAFVDFTLLPIFDIGIHGGYNTITADSSVPDSKALKWVSAGAHASLTF